ncbi:MAG: hypothetical protein ACLUQK_03855 [Clostridium sp.]
MAEKKVVRYKLVRHKWPDEIQAEKRRRQRRAGVIAICIVCFFGGFFLNSTLHQTSAASSDEFQKLEIYTLMSEKFYFGKDQEKSEAEADGWRNQRFGGSRRRYSYELSG